MVEESLPPEILLKASRRGDEYAWRLPDVLEVIAAARALGLATLGGQVQFRTPGGTCELHWLSADAEDRHPGESWEDYVARSADEVSRKVRSLAEVTNFIGEGISFPHLAELRSKGEALEEYLCFVLYFEQAGA
jgi:hypothetical protein